MCGGLRTNARLLALVEDRRELAPVRLELVILGPQVVALVLLAARLRGGARKLLELLLESSCGAVLQLQQLLRAALEQLRRPRLRLLVAPADRRLELEPERAHRAYERILGKPRERSKHLVNRQQAGVAPRADPGSGPLRLPRSNGGCRTAGE